MVQLVNLINFNALIGSYFLLMSELCQMHVMNLKTTYIFLIKKYNSQLIFTYKVASP